MKKTIVLLSIMSLPLIFGCSESETFDDSYSVISNTTTSQEFGSKKAKSIGGTWSIGRKSKSCRGLGLCRLKAVHFNNYTIKVDRTFYSDIKIINTNKFILYVDEENMSEIVNGYGGEYLILEEDFIFDQEEITALNLAENFTIGEGVYGFLQDTETSLYWVEISNKE